MRIPVDAAAVTQRSNEMPPPAYPADPAINVRRKLPAAASTPCEFDEMFPPSTVGPE